MFDYTNTHLTKRQLEVLKRKREGKSVQEIAEELNTSRSNVSHILSSAVENVEKAENTLKFVRTVEWPIRMEFKSGVDLFKISSEIFQKADEGGIHLDFTGSELVGLLGESIRGLVDNRKTKTGIIVVMSEDGEIEVLTSN